MRMALRPFWPDGDDSAKNGEAPNGGWRGGGKNGEAPMLVSYVRENVEGVKNGGPPPRLRVCRFSSIYVARWFPAKLRSDQLVLV